jgi:hypothetical protein
MGLAAAVAYGQGQTQLITLGTTTTLTGPQSSTYGQTVALVATVASIGVVAPSGTVVFQDNGVTLGIVTLTGIEDTRTSQAPFSTSSLTAGPHSITASYQGNSSSAASSSSPLTLTIGKAGTFFSALNSDVSDISVGDYITLSTAIHFPGTIPPSGTVLFEDVNRNITVGFATVQSSPGNALVNLSTNSLNAGSYNVTATYQGDANYLPCTSGADPFIVSQGSAALTLTPSNNPSSFGQPVTFTASYNSNGAPPPSGSVTFKDGTNTLGTGTLSGGAAAILASALSAGTHSITVVYGGDSNYKASTSAALTQKVNNASLSSTQTTLTSSLNPSIVGQPVNLTATVTGSGGTPTGTVTFKDGSTVIVSGVALSGGMATFQDPSLTAGTHSLTAVYSGDSNYSSSTSAKLSETIFSSPDATTNTVVSSANPSSPGQSVTFTATVTASGGWVPGNDGFLTFWDGTTELGTVVVQNGKGSYPISTLSLGTHSITANYGGDLVFAPSTSAVLTQTVSNTITTTTSLASSANPSTVGQGVTFTATVTPNGSGTPTGTVTFKDGASTLGNGSLNNGHATFTTSSLSTGSHSITAVYDGDSNFSGSTSAVLSQTVSGNTGGTTSTSVSGSPNPASVGQAITFTATVSSSGSGTPTGTVTFEDGATDLGTSPVSGGQAVFNTSALSLGAHSITAVYGGDSNFTGSMSAVLTETVQDSAAGTTSALAHFAAGSTWTTGIFVVNTGNQAAGFSIAFFDDAGNPAALPFSSGATSTLAGSLPANGSAYFEAANPLDALISGWGRITSDPSIVVQALFRNDANGSYYEAAVPSSAGGKEFLIPFDATTFAGNGQQFYTGFAVANLDQSTATISCIARDSSGTVIPNAIPVPALSPMGHWANYLFPALAGLRGTIDCSSNTNIAGIALRFIGTSAFSSLPVIADPAGFSGGSNAALAHFAAGDTWTTGFFVLNTGTSPAQFSIAFHDDNGNPVALPFSTGATNTLSGTVPAQGSAYYEAGNPQAPLTSGSAQITADPTIVVQALFRDDSSGRYYEAAVPSSSGSQEFLFPFDATTFAGNGQPFYTGFAIANLSGSPADLICTARDQNGVVIPDAVPVPELSSFGHWANYLFPALTGMRGTIDCVASTSVAATALRFIGTSAFSSLPVITK